MKQPTSQWKMSTMCKRIASWCPRSKRPVEGIRCCTQRFKAYVHTRLGPYSKMDAFITGTMMMTMTITIILLVQQAHYYKHDDTLTDDRIALQVRVAEEMRSAEALNATIEQLEAQAATLSATVRQLEAQNAALMRKHATASQKRLARSARFHRAR
ncbi:MAG: hypothetical protein LBQ26_00915 [Holosporales bacterium]|nr:hypothetical protein [Holosporales bacterium]